MKKSIALSAILLMLAGCTKDKCYVVLDSDYKELCAKCFHTTDERAVWMTANANKTPQEKCQ